MNKGELTKAVATACGMSQSDAAKANLEAAGYADSGDGIYEHPEKGRLTLRVGTTGGNALRELQQQLIQAQLKESGIEIVIDNVDGGAYFGERPFSDDAIACSTSGGTEGNCEIWDITQFAWVGGPWPGGQAESYRTGSGNNPYGYASAEFDAKADECDATVDDAERAEAMVRTALELRPDLTVLARAHDGDHTRLADDVQFTILFHVILQSGKRSATDEHR